jgi:hypothetical protein
MAIYCLRAFFEHPLTLANMNLLLHFTGNSEKVLDLELTPDDRVK